LKKGTKILSDLDHFLGLPDGQVNYNFFPPGGNILKKSCSV